MDGSDGQDGKTDIGKIRAVGPMSPNILLTKRFQVCRGVGPEAIYRDGRD